MLDRIFFFSIYHHWWWQLNYLTQEWILCGFEYEEYGLGWVYVNNMQ
jgi:hypothetical protein